MPDHKTETFLLQILDQIAREVSGELDLESVFANTARLIKQVVDYTTFVIALVNDEGEFDLALQQGYDPDKLDQLKLKTDMGIIGLAVNKKEIVIIDDVDVCKQYVRVKTASGDHTRSMAAVPLISKDLVIGAIGIECREEACFTDDHQLMLNSIASHLAAAIANAKIFGQTVEQIQLMRLIEQISQDITSVLDLEQLLKEIARLTKQVIEYHAFGIFLSDRNKNEFIPHFAVGYDKVELAKKSLRLDQGLRGEALKYGRPILAGDVLNNPVHVQHKLEIDDQIRSQMYIPLKTQKTTIGVLVLGNIKKNYYNRRHLRIAQAMAQQIAISVENAQIFEEVTQSEEKLRHELEIARNLQLSMLPDCCPLIDGYELQAISKPAMHVGGDFYDFIPLPNDRMGIVIGDVSGFGVSAALVMASAREVIRIYAELYENPASVLNKADYRLSKDIMKHMFVALLYGILDYKNNRFVFANAGLIEPIHLRKNCAEFLDSPGTRLPLGKMPNSNYQNMTINLEKNDVLVLSTDGSTEAYNSKEEPFGFGRLRKSVLDAGQEKKTDTGYMDVISKINSDLASFTGSNHFQDDVTLMTIQVTDKNQ